MSKLGLKTALPKPYKMTSNRLDANLHRAYYRVTRFGLCLDILLLLASGGVLGLTAAHLVLVQSPILHADINSLAQLYQHGHTNPQPEKVDEPLVKSSCCENADKMVCLLELEKFGVILLTAANVILFRVQILRWMCKPDLTKVRWTRMGLFWAMMFIISGVLDVCIDLLGKINHCDYGQYLMPFKLRLHLRVVHNLNGFCMFNAMLVALCSNWISFIP